MCLNVCKVSPAACTPARCSAARLRAAPATAQQQEVAAGVAFHCVQQQQLGGHIERRPKRGARRSAGADAGAAGGCGGCVGRGVHVACQAGSQAQRQAQQLRPEADLQRGARRGAGRKKASWPFCQSHASQCACWHVAQSMRPPNNKHKHSQRPPEAGSCRRRRRGDARARLEQQQAGGQADTPALVLRGQPRPHARKRQHAVPASKWVAMQERWERRQGRGTPSTGRLDRGRTAAGVGRCRLAGG